MECSCLHIRWWKHIMHENKSKGCIHKVLTLSKWNITTEAMLGKVKKMSNWPHPPPPGPLPPDVQPPPGCWPVTGPSRWWQRTASVSAAAWWVGNAPCSQRTLPPKSPALWQTRTRSSPAETNQPLSLSLDCQTRAQCNFCRNTWVMYNISNNNNNKN